MWVLRFILHDWNDSDAARILAALRGAMGGTPVTLCICEARVSSILKLQYHLEQHTKLGFQAYMRKFTSATQTQWQVMWLCACWQCCALRLCHACHISDSATPVSYSKPALA